MYRLLFFMTLLMGQGLALFAQDEGFHWLDKKEDAKVEPYFMLQLWGSYNFGMEVFDEETEQYKAVENRLNVLLRRARFGFRYQPYEQLKFNLHLAYDQLGRDVLASGVGGFNNDSRPTLYIFDAFAQYQIKPESDALVLTGGYFRPQLGRESITSAWSVNSMEKSMTQNYLRRHLVGIGPGRAVGLNLGGLVRNAAHQAKWNYNLGIFFPQSFSATNATAGVDQSPLIAGRVVSYLGDPEQANYKIGYDINYYGKRNGLSLGLGGSYQGANELFKASYVLSGDFLFNWGLLNADGEWNFLFRKGIELMGDNSLRSFTYGSDTWHIRLGYNLIFQDKYFLEPVFMLMQFNGGTGLQEQTEAALVGAFSGWERTYDAGVNWYLNKKHLKIMLHYTWREGNAGEAEAGTRVNQYFSQAGAGAIRRGDWLGLGVNTIF